MGGISLALLIIGILMLWLGGHPVMKVAGIVFILLAVFGAGWIALAAPA